MAEKPDHGPRGAASDTARDDRLKAALKANLAKRKAQSRGRAAGQMPEPKAEEDNRSD